jgi:hypothetical protein
MVLDGKKWKGVNMYEAHKNLGLTDEHFDVTAGHLISSLKIFRVPQDLIDEIVAVGRRAPAALPCMLAREAQQHAGPTARARPPGLHASCAPVHHVPCLAPSRGMHPCALSGVQVASTLRGQITGKVDGNGRPIGPPQSVYTKLGGADGIESLVDM